MTQSGGCSEQQDVRNNYRNGRLPRPPRSPAPRGGDCRGVDAADQKSIRALTNEQTMLRNVLF